LVLSYTAPANNATQQIYKQLYQNMVINSNVSIINDRKKLADDTKRWEDANTLQTLLNNYMALTPNHDDFPHLLSGTYRAGMSVSTWDSWQNTLGVALGESGFDLTYKPKFVGSISMEELVGVPDHGGRVVGLEPALLRDLEVEGGVEGQPLLHADLVVQGHVHHGRGQQVEGQACVPEGRRRRGGQSRRGDAGDPPVNPGVGGCEHPRGGSFGVDAPIHSPLRRIPRAGAGSGRGESHFERGPGAGESRGLPPRPRPPHPSSSLLPPAAAAAAGSNDRRGRNAAHLAPGRRRTSKTRRWSASCRPTSPPARGRGRSISARLSV